MAKSTKAAMATKSFEVTIPEYRKGEKPDYLRIGRKVDEAIALMLPDGTYILRAISSDDHKGRSLNELAEIVLKTGTDKHDPERKGVCHDEFLGYDYHIHAGTIEVKDSKVVRGKDDKYPTVFGSIAYLFFEHAPLDRGYPVRIDRLIFYDPTKLRRARKIHPKARGVRKGLNNYLYTFKEPNNKKAALVGILKILR